MRLRYGRSHVTLPLGGVPILRAPSIRPQRSPLSFPGLDAFLASARRVVIVVSDGTRYTGVERIIPQLARRLRGRTAEVLFATGLHRPTTPDERRRILGMTLAGHDHDPRRDLVHLGRSPRGVPVRVNRRLVLADRVIVTGTVALHYLAGYGGGWKAIFPGCAAEETILGLHRLTILDDAERCEPGRLDGNPFREEIDACGAFFPIPAYAIQTVLAADGRIAAVFCGDVLDAHRRAAREAERLHSAPVRGPVDRLVASAGGHPKDINLIQAHKAIEHATRVLRPGGSLTLLAACPDGLGYPAFERWFGHASPARLAAALRKRFHVYGRTAWALWRKAERYRIRLISEMPDALVRRLRFEPVRTADAADLVFPDAGSVLPRLEIPSRSHDSLRKTDRRARRGYGENAEPFS
ncbi:MAG: nickel-dependent lactate racemase [Planctomycetes bacterium]|nr:nickel-dependent lactate racemase [Planctomycetota bacterium]